MGSSRYFRCEHVCTRLQMSASVVTSSTALGYEGGALVTFSNPLQEKGVRRRALLHWLVWAVAGFGWTGLVFFAALCFVRAADPSYSDMDWPVSRSQLASGCDFDFFSQILVVVSEVPGTLLVHLFIDKPQGACSAARRTLHSWAGRGVRV